MSCSDPIGDMLTIIRNGVMAGKTKVNFPHSRAKEALCRVLADEGYVNAVEVLDTKPARTLRVALRWSEDGESPIHEIRRVSKPGRRIYTTCKAMVPVLRGFGITVLSTSRGVLSDRACRAAKLGGEVLCVVR